MDTVLTATHQLMDYTERVLRQRIAEIPDGEYRAEGFLDDDGRNRDVRLPIKVCVRVKGDGIEIDLTGSADQVETGFNVPFEGSTKVACFCAIRSLLLDAVQSRKCPRHSRSWGCPRGAARSSQLASGSYCPVVSRHRPRGPAIRNPCPPIPALHRGAGHRLRLLRRTRERSRLESKRGGQDRRRLTRHPRPSPRPEEPPQSGEAPAARDRPEHRSTTPVERSGTSTHPRTSARPRHDVGPPDPHPGAAGEPRTRCQSEPTGSTRRRRCSRSSSTVIRSGHVPA